MSPYARSVDSERKRWAAAQAPQCMRCYRRSKDLDVHEIEPRSMAPNRWGHTCNYLLLCRSCHEDIHASPGYFTPARQLAIKLLGDPEGFDLLAWCRLRVPNGRQVVLREVVRHLTAVW